MDVACAAGHLARPNLQEVKELLLSGLMVRARLLSSPPKQLRLLARLPTFRHTLPHHAHVLSMQGTPPLHARMPSPAAVCHRLPPPATNMPACHVLQQLLQGPPSVPAGLAVNPLTSTLQPLQLQQLPQDPFHPHSLPLLVQMSNLFTTTPAPGSTAYSMTLHLLSLDVVPALLERLLRLAPQPHTSSGAEGSSQSATEAPATPPSGPSSGGATPTAPSDRFTLWVRHTIITTNIMTIARLLLEHVTIGSKTAAGDDDLVVVPMEQLLSSPAALQVAVHRGLSAEVQGAARGGSAVAAGCMAAVGSCFRQAAAVLRLHTGIAGAVGDQRGKALSGRLASFLRLEENLPFLELLCLPHGESAPHIQ
jgi:hypothetical protein